MKIYGITAVGQFGFALIINCVFLIGGYRAAKYYHKAVMTRLIRAPMSFFDSQPIGRILNRVSKDIESVDQQIWIILFLSTISCAGALSSMAFLCYVDQRMIALVIPLVFIYFFFLKYYQRSNIEFKRFESLHRSPLNAHISETLGGISTVKAYRIEKQFVAKQRQLMNDANTPTYLRLKGGVWVAIRLELLSSTLTLCLALLAVLSAGEAALTGLSLTYAIGFARLLNLLLISTSQLENEFNSIERLSYYCDQLPQEPPELLPEDPKESEWPLHGVMDFQNVTLSYPTRPDVLILKDLSFSVKSGEKVGIIGRTGSGKSTLTTAIYRLVELVNGSITIDGVNISKMGLKTLRSRLQIIPQEPVLFSGTIRDNLDVEGKYQDVEIWEVLERIGLKEYVSSLSEKLQSSVIENGENLSLGQRQLICLGRAILVKPKVLIMGRILLMLR
jgi:ABC-type multidrug transport system fused ATPase/permease subunit